MLKSIKILINKTISSYQLEQRLQSLQPPTSVSSDKACFLILQPKSNSRLIIPVLNLFCFITFEGRMVDNL